MDDRLESTDQLVLGASVENRSTHIEQPLGIIVEITNVGSQPVATCLRMLVNTCSSPIEVRDLCFQIEGPPDYINSTVFSVRAGPAGLGDYGVLSPGRTHIRRFPLTRYESLDWPVEYLL